MTKTRSLAHAGLVLALVLVAAACGGQPFPEASSPTTARVVTTPANAHAQLLAAVERTNAAKTARFAMEMSMTGLGGNTDAATITGSGAMDLVHRRVEAKIESSEPVKMSMEMRVIGNTAYANTGSGWTSQAVNTAGATMPIPTNYLDYLKGLAGTVRVTGHEQVRGADTTKYSATIDFSSLEARAGTASQRAVVKQLLDQLGMTKIPVAVWVDDLGRMRKLTMTMDLSALGAFAAKMGGPADFAPKMTMTLEMYDFGAPVSVQVPAGAKPAPAGAEPNFCLGDGCGDSGSADTTHEIQADLRNALTAEKVTYTDNVAYTADVAMLKEIEPNLDWGGKLKVVVGDASGTADAVVCLSETVNGVTYALADVASGFAAGTYYGAAPCPAKVTDATVATFGSTW